VVAPKTAAGEICRVIGSAGVTMKQVGHVEAGTAEAVLRVDGKDHDFSPRFRESAYTPVKKVVDTETRDFDEMKAAVLRASESAIKKKERVLSRLKQKAR
jgi:hydrogenase expression/formation protein